VIDRTESTLELPEAIASDVAAVRSAVPAGFIDAQAHRGDVWVRVHRESIVEALQCLRDQVTPGYRFFSECVGVDYLDPKTGQLIMGREERFEVIYNLAAFVPSSEGVGAVRRIFVAVSAPEADPTVPSVTELFAGASFPEREIYDMFGIRFQGHPDLRRLLMSDDWIGHPQRKDYPLGGERVRFPAEMTGPSINDRLVQHPGESFFGPTAEEFE